MKWSDICDIDLLSGLIFDFWSDIKVKGHLNPLCINIHLKKHLHAAQADDNHEKSADENGS